MLIFSQNHGSENKDTEDWNSYYKNCILASKYRRLEEPDDNEEDEEEEVSIAQFLGHSTRYPLILDTKETLQQEI